jgi:hypothetical protein
MKINYFPLKAISIVILALNFGILSMAQYTLSDDDVVVMDGIIQSCSYDFTIKDIIIPEILDGQTVKGIAQQQISQEYFKVKVLQYWSYPQQSFISGRMLLWLIP